MGYFLYVHSRDQLESSNGDNDYSSPIMMTAAKQDYYLLALPASNSARFSNDNTSSNTDYHLVLTLYLTHIQIIILLHYQLPIMLVSNYNTSSETDYHLVLAL